jgi:hypothetical protein
MHGDWLVLAGGDRTRKRAATGLPLRLQLLADDSAALQGLVAHRGHHHHVHVVVCKHR